MWSHHSWKVKPNLSPPRCRARDRDRLFKAWFKRVKAVGHMDTAYPLMAETPDQWGDGYFFTLWSQGYTPLDAYLYYKAHEPWIIEGW